MKEKNIRILIAAFVAGCLILGLAACTPAMRPAQEVPAGVTQSAD